MNIFQKKFFNLVKEAPELEPDPTLPVPDDESSEIEAATDTLETNTDINSFGAPDNPEIALKKQQSEKTIHILNTWIGEVENFIDYLNGTDEGSINSRQHLALKNTLPVWSALFQTCWTLRVVPHCYINKRIQTVQQVRLWSFLVVQTQTDSSTNHQ